MSAKAQERVLCCQDTVALVLGPAFKEQQNLVRLFRVNKLFKTAAQSMDVWAELAWESASRKSRCTDQAVPALCLSIERWWGARLKTFDAGSGCPTHRELLTDDTLALIARSAPRLQSIRLWGCQHITNHGLKRLAVAAPPLRSFSLSWCGSGVCLDGLRAVVRACPALECFAISCDQQSVGLASVGDEFVAELAAACPLISSLELSDTSVGDPGLATIATAYGPQLSALALNYTQGWSGRALAELAGACPQLRVFSAVGARAVTDDALAALGASCRHLALVCLDRCPGVTLDGVLRLVNRSTNNEGGSALRHVEMAGTWRRSSREQQAFFTQWVDARGFHYNAHAGVLTVSSGFQG